MGADLRAGDNEEDRCKYVIASYQKRPPSPVWTAAALQRQAAADLLCFW